MNETDIRKYAVLMQELGLTGLEITEGTKAVRLDRSAPVTVTETIAVPGDLAVSRDSSDGQKENKNYISVKSPVVGVFYAAPTENVSPYVAIGDRVQKGQILCIVEAMKLMNEIAAEEDGVITEICVTNGQVVEFGTELFRMRK
ncbi:MAG: acetyl-CoA carboxylase, biotin carboxyl carrier protein [Lachnospiraceae bacterium]|nr:acetyl-CoA carboxylase, biotin carboxyl carrier protein [Lachnospiraceae bacterium]